MSLEDKLAKWAQQPGAVVTAPERQFIEDMRKAARAGVGYGWMQQIIEWEWQSVGSEAWGPEIFNSENNRLRAERDEAVEALNDIANVKADPDLEWSSDLEIYQHIANTCKSIARTVYNNLTGEQDDG